MKDITAHKASDPPSPQIPSKSSGGQIKNIVVGVIIGIIIPIVLNLLSIFWLPNFWPDVYYCQSLPRDVQRNEIAANGLIVVNNSFKTTKPVELSFVVDVNIADIAFVKTTMTNRDQTTLSKPNIKLVVRCYDSNARMGIASAGLNSSTITVRWGNGIDSRSRNYIGVLWLDKQTEAGGAQEIKLKVGSKYCASVEHRPWIYRYCILPITGLILFVMFVTICGTMSVMARRQRREKDRWIRERETWLQTDSMFESRISEKDSKTTD